MRLALLQRLFVSERVVGQPRLVPDCQGARRRAFAPWRATFAGNRHVKVDGVDGYA